MNAKTVGHELGEALIHLEDLVAKLRNGMIGPNDEPAVAVQLGPILDHMSRAWNCSDLPPEQHANLPQVEFERLSNTVPNFLGTRTIGDLALG